MKCIDATRLASESQDRDLRLPEKASLTMHLMICSGCRRFTEQLGVLRQALRRVDGLAQEGVLPQPPASGPDQNEGHGPARTD